MKENILKVSISKNANLSLKSMMSTMNKTTPNTTKKHALLSWIIQDYEKHYFAKKMNKILKETLAPLDYAKALIHQMEASGDGRAEPKQVRALLREASKK